MTETTHIERPKVYDFDDFRELIRAFISHLRSKGEFSNRKFAQEVGFKSHSFLLMIISGKRKLKLDAARKISQGLKLSTKEETYFLQLVEFNQTKEPQRKKELFEKLVSLRTDKKTEVMVLDQYDFYSNWYNPVLYESLPLEFKEIDMAELVQELDIEEEEIAHSLELLERLKLVERRGNEVKRLEFALQTHEIDENIMVRQFHLNMIQKAHEAVETLPSSQRDVSCLTVSISPETYSSVVEKIRLFRSEMNELLSKTPARGSVYQMNFQFFPILTPFEEED